jgi:hypothetical protein
MIEDMSDEVIGVMASRPASLSPRRLRSRGRRRRSCQDNPVGGRRDDNSTAIVVPPPSTPASAFLTHPAAPSNLHRPLPPGPRGYLPGRLSDTGPQPGRIGLDGPAGRCDHLDLRFHSFADLMITQSLVAFGMVVSTRGAGPQQIYSVGDPIAAWPPAE